LLRALIWRGLAGSQIIFPSSDDAGLSLDRNEILYSSVRIQSKQNKGMNDWDLQLDRRATSLHRADERPIRTKQDFLTSDFLHFQ
jgi:hypothetical protein